MHRDKPKTRKVELRDKVEESSGNVFADLGFENPEGMLARAELARRICEIIAGRKLTKSQAAKILGHDEPEVSASRRGTLDGFSTDRMFEFINALGRDVEIVIRPAMRAGEAVTRVISA